MINDYCLVPVCGLDAVEGRVWDMRQGSSVRLS
jgi:hypothetical protein